MQTIYATSDYDPTRDQREYRGVITSAALGNSEGYSLRLQIAYQKEHSCMLKESPIDTLIIDNGTVLRTLVDKAHEIKERESRESEPMDVVAELKDLDVTAMVQTISGLEKVVGFSIR